MVKVKDLPKFMNEVQELFGFMMSQEIAKSSLTPKDTTRMAKSFTATYRYEEGKIKWTVPHYTKFVNDGTKKIKARRFLQKIFHQNSERILKKAFRIINKRYK